MQSRTVLVTGSSGLVGSAVVEHFSALGYEVFGVDNNQRKVFFGPDGDTSPTLRRVQERCPRFVHYPLDIRNRERIQQIIAEIIPDVVIHAAGQPSHDLAARIPYDDFDTNAVGTLNMLEAVRLYAPKAIFVFLSTNKVYGDWPNSLPMIEENERWEFSDPHDRAGISESAPIDRSLHSVFGASKVAADIMVQEYARTFGIATCCLRCGCLTGPSHAGAELHGFLNYLVRSNIEGRPYTIYGYKGKQVRDNLHAEDVCGFIEQFVHAPRPGEVYNLGGGRENTCSVLEAIGMIERLSGRTMRYEYRDQARSGDHRCYYSNLSKARSHYPQWTIARSLESILAELVYSRAGECNNTQLPRTNTPAH